MGIDEQDAQKEKASKVSARNDAQSKGVNQYTKIAVYMVVGLIIIFFIFLRLLFLFEYFPNWFHNEAAASALRSLHDNLYDGIALVSFFVGVFSIWYAWSSSKLWKSNLKSKKMFYRIFSKKAQKSCEKSQ